MIQLNSRTTCDKSPVSCLPILIMGVGNYLMSDDGIGVHAIHALQRLTLPRNIELLDAGTATMSFLSNLSGRRKVIIIDAVRSGKPAGTLYRFSPDDIYVQKETAISLHQVGIIENIALSGFIDEASADIVVYGIEPGNMECGMSLSPEVEAGLPKLIDRICTELDIGIPV